MESIVDEPTGLYKVTIKCSCNAVFVATDKDRMTAHDVCWAQLVEHKEVGIGR
jgi:hypothetical protein